METLQSKRQIATLYDFDWEHFMAEYWDQAPVLIKGYHKETIISEEDFFTLFKLQSEQILAGKRAGLTLYDKNRVSLSGENASIRFRTGIEDYLPHNKFADLRDYLNWLASVDRFNEFCVYADSPHTYKHIWEKMKGQFREIFRHTNMSPHGMNTDLFIGNYERTNFGAHKDQLSNFMFLVFGTRRMLLWSEHTWKKVLNNPDNNKLVVQNYEPFREEAIVVEMEAGDMLYWPSEYWHVGENDGTLSGSINIDYVESDSLTEVENVIGNSLTKIIRQESANHTKNYDRDYFHFEEDESAQMSLPDNITERYKLLIRHFANPQLFTFFLESEWLRKISAMGFIKGLQPRETPAGVSAAAVVRSDKDYPVYYKAIDDKLVLAHSGVLKVLDLEDGLIRLVEHLNKGGNIPASALYSRFMAEFASRADFDNALLHFYEIHAIELG